MDRQASVLDYGCALKVKGFSATDVEFDEEAAPRSCVLVLSASDF